MSWKVEYNQGGVWNPMAFTGLDVQTQPGGLIKGRGSDPVGEFTFEGSFNTQTPECRILKQYIGKHAIYYQGQLNHQDGTVNGAWGFQPGGKDG
jgi:hypothetical protein